MAKFKDKANREWRVEIDVFLLEQVVKATGVRLDRLLAEQAAVLTDLLEDTVLTVRVIWTLVEEQAEKLAVTPEQFGRSLAGDHLDDAVRAFLEAVADFSPRHQRKLLRALVAKGTEVQERAVTTALRSLEAAGPETSASSASATSSPASSGSTPVVAG